MRRIEQQTRLLETYARRLAPQRSTQPRNTPRFDVIHHAIEARLRIARLGADARQALFGALHVLFGGLQ